MKKIIDAHGEGLTPHQREAYEQLAIDLLTPGSCMRKLQGYAGTGKTFLAGRICRVLEEADVSFVVAAPTHTAAAQVRLALGAEFSGEVQSRTLASLLGLQLRGDGANGYQLVPKGEPKLPEGGVVVCDEGSMIGEGEWAFIEAMGDGVRWLFLGDPAQLPPVNEDPSPVFDLPGPELTEVVRQAKDNPILDLATRIRNRESYLLPQVIRYEEGQGVAVTKNQDAFIESAVRAFEEKGFDEDARHARVLAYRNSRVEYYNQRIRNAIYGEDAPEYVEGEWLVGQSTWYLDEQPMLLNSEAVKITSAERSVDELALGGQWPIWTLRVKPRGRHEREIHVLAREGQEEYQAKVDDYKQRAQSAEDPDARRSNWKNYYKLLEQYARVSPAFATTIHKSQGTTLKTAWVDDRDIRIARPKERHALQYVAATRPSERLGLLI